MDKSDRDENRLIAERRRKLTETRAEGQAFPNEFRRDALADQLHASFGERSKEALDSEAITVKVGGRMMAKRVMGKTSFAKLQDRSGQIQLMVSRERLGEEAYRRFKAGDLGDILGAEGVLCKTKTGELSVRVDHLHALVKSLRPLPDKWHGLTDQEQRYRRRYVDLIVNEASRNTFKIRTRVVAFMRAFLDSLDFMEVETPMMQPIAGGAAARPFMTHHNALDMTLYLRIAPELYLKRLLVGGMERVYEINRSFRNEGLSTQHNPEFTMLELYQAYADYREVMAHAEALVRESARSVLGTTVIEYQGVSLDLGEPFRRITVVDSLLEFGVDLDAARLRDVDYLRGVCEQHELPTEPHWQAGKLQIELFERWVEPKLEQPTFVTQYPAEVSPLARRNDEDPFVTDRFELFVTGREIANGFSELNDPEDQAERFAEQVKAKSAGDDEAMLFDEDYIRALEYGMPPAGGLGIGIDRLVMLLTDSASIRDVLLFPHMRLEESR
jgi:lysyl-tRNA synthetase class 2